MFIPLVIGVIIFLFIIIIDIFYIPSNDLGFIFSILEY